MTDFIIKKLPYDLSYRSGQAFVGKYLKGINVNALIDSYFTNSRSLLQNGILNLITNAHRLHSCDGIWLVH